MTFLLAVALSLQAPAARWESERAVRMRYWAFRSRNPQRCLLR